MEAAPQEHEGAEAQVPELTQERKEAVVDKLVKTSLDLNGGLEAAERGEFVRYGFKKSKDANGSWSKTSSLRISCSSRC
jgi:hypothetical protein